MADPIRVRMYNVGFGDSFLVEFPRAGSTPFRVLVDCGAHSAGYPRPGWKPEDTVDRIIDDTRANGADPRIDLVVATHRHQDHVSGFRAKAWAAVTVGEVWMPWTEHPSDQLAREVRNRQSRLALGLERAFADPGFGMRWTDPLAADALRGLVANSLTNEKAMATLHTGFRGHPKRCFLPDDEPRRSFADCPGLTVHVLGPSRDLDVVRDMDPPSGQSYLRYADSAPVTGDRAGRTQIPFARAFTFEAPVYESGNVGPVLDPDIKAAAAEMMRDDDFSVAVALDKAVNGTSLMLMFEFGEAFLLFPGDAQWGTWNAALTNPDTRELIRRTTFYKVGHHGSHNATPVEFLETALDVEATMWGAAASVRPIDFWPEIPRQPLMERLAQRADRVIRSDIPGGNQAGVGVRGDGVGVDFKVPW